MAVLGDYRIVDSTGAYISESFAYTRSFNTYRRAHYNAWLMIWYKSFYTNFARAASVRVNGSEVGKLFPNWRSSDTHYGFTMEVVPFVFPGSTLSSAGGPANTLEIVPNVGSDRSDLMVTNIICHFKESEAF